MNTTLKPTSIDLNDRKSQMTGRGVIKVALIVITLFHFVSPPFNDDSSIFLPTRLDLPDSPMYAISSVGEDHVCLTITQQSVETLCIPFTNIAVIREVNLR